MARSNRTVRGLALDIALAADRTDRFLEDILDETLDSAKARGLDERDRRLLAEIVLGSCRRRVTLDHLIARFSSRPLDKIDPALLELLRQAVYQLVYLDRVPAHAAVNEAVELAASTGHRGGKSFANAVLRAVSAAILAEGPGAAVLPAGARLVHFREALLPDPAEDLAGYLSVVGSMPRVLVERWLNRWSANTVQQISEAANTTPELYVHPNGLRTDAEGLMKALAEEGRTLQKTVLAAFFKIDPAEGIAELSAFKKGLFWAMDPASSRAVAALQAAPGQRVLDLCSAPGAKTALIAEDMGNTGELLAVDSSPERLALVRENAARLGLSMVRTTVADGRKTDTIVHGEFDRVLVDAPCSNTGVLERRVEARHRFDPARLDELNALQRDLLSAGARVLRRAGRLVYSTCSLELEENEAVLEAVVKASPELAVESSQTYLPEPGQSDGGYVGVIAKAGAGG